VGRRESARAAEAYRRYRDLGAGRSLSKLHEQFLKQAAESRQNAGKTPMPPTTSKQMLEEWSACFGWVARAAVHDAEIDHARRAEQIRQTEQQARENARLQQQVGAGALGVCALALSRLIDSDTGELVEMVPVRDLPQLMRSGAELLGLATGSPTQIIASQQDSTQLERCLRESDPETREAVLRGLRAALAWTERNTQGGG
jgi:hypothetical protein